MSSAEYSDASDIDVSEARRLVGNVNRKKKKKAGGFQAMGLSVSVFNGIRRKGYNAPTPIQRKAIPAILSGRDVVAMARTGSGKTAAFLIPLLERLRLHQNTGARALLLSPTRELAMQTLTFTRDIGQFTNLVAAVIVGGDKMEDQFMAVHQNPDIIIATPGRLLHVIMEMNLSLKSIEFVVFDEGDRLFEMGFAEQLTETLHRLPSKRQTLVFSATLPGVLLEFARAGLSEPALIRLDVDSRLSSQLTMAFLSCLPFQKEALLIHLLQTIIPEREQVVIFLATKHHVDYLEVLLKEFKINCTVVHSGLDPVARTIAVKNFREGKVRCLLVTDLAARGIDVPLLDNVINFHFPAQAKLFVHRVGRVARAGRTGMAISLVDAGELPYLLDLFVFLGRQLITSGHHIQDQRKAGFWTNELLGSCPSDLITVSLESANKLERENIALSTAAPVCKRALCKYLSIRPKCSAESVRRAKEIRDNITALAPHPIFGSQLDAIDTKKEAMLEILRNRKVLTIFEAMGKTANPEAYKTMQTKRRIHDRIIAKVAAETQTKRKRKILLEGGEDHHLAIDGTTVRVAKTLVKDEIAPAGGASFFVPAMRHPAEEGAERRSSTKTGDQDVGASGSFALSAEAARLDVQGDEVGISHGRPAGSRKSLQVWDRKKKRFVNADIGSGKANVARIKTESGVSIPASYKTDKYEIWLKRSKAHLEGSNSTAGLTETDQSVFSGGGDKLRDSKQPSTRETAKRQRFSSLFNARYGSVVEFMDSDDDGEKLFNRRTGTRWSQKNRSGRYNEKHQDISASRGGGGVKVVGTMSRRTCDAPFHAGRPHMTPWSQNVAKHAKTKRLNLSVARMQRNLADREAGNATKEIRQAKGSRTFGQMRKPEQILKQRRRKDRENQFRLKNKAKNAGGGGKGGGAKGRHKH